MRMREGSASGAPGSERCGDVVLGAGFWVALLVLVLNDHVLKGSGLVPEIVTGKLSDVAGLWVAPPLACVLLRARTRRARFAVFAFVGGLFTAVNTFPAAAVLAGEGLTALGIPSRLWCDSTDLLALVVLPLAWRGSRCAVRSVAASGRLLGLALASLACLATSVEAPEEVETFPPYVVNETRLPVTLELGVRLDPECAGEAGDASVAELTPPAPDQRVTLDPGELVELGAPAPDTGQGACGVATAQLAGGASVTIAWDRAAGEPQIGDLFALELDAGLRRFQLDQRRTDVLSRSVVVTGSATRPVLQPADDLRLLAVESGP
jgi:hypothetical protein